MIHGRILKTYGADLIFAVMRAGAGQNSTQHHWLFHPLLRQAWSLAVPSGSRPRSILSCECLQLRSIVVFSIGSAIADTQAGKRGDHLRCRARYGAVHEGIKAILRLLRWQTK